MDNNKKIVIEALEQAKGIVTSACKAVSMPRSTFYHWYNNDPEFKEAVDDIQEVAIDYVESKLLEKIEGVQMVNKALTNSEEPPTYTLPPSDTAIIFYLKTKGKKRGYVEKTEVDNRHSGGVNVSYVSQPGNEPLNDDN